MKTTYFLNDGGVCRKQNGHPRSVEVFLRNAKGCNRVELATYGAYGSMVKTFYRVGDKWQGVVFDHGDGTYSRAVLVACGNIMKVVSEDVTPQEAAAEKAAEVAKVMPEARKAISWCNPEDESDEDGRYWLSAYRGCGVYRLITSGGRILGAIEGGIHGSKRAAVSDAAWFAALRAAIEERISGDYQLLKADGSGTYFYLRYAEDSKYLQVTEYDVPTTDGGTHHNIEAR